MGRKLSLFEWLLLQRYRHSKGNSEIDFLKNLFIGYAVVQMYLNNYLGMKVSAYLIIFALMGYMTASWLLGYWWDIKGLYNVETEISNKRNNFIKEMRDKFHFERTQKGSKYRKV